MLCDLHAGCVGPRTGGDVTMGVCRIVWSLEIPIEMSTEVAASWVVLPCKVAGQLAILELRYLGAWVIHMVCRSAGCSRHAHLLASISCRLLQKRGKF